MTAVAIPTIIKLCMYPFLLSFFHIPYETLDDLVQPELLQDGEADDPWDSNNLMQ